MPKKWDILNQYLNLLEDIELSKMIDTQMETELTRFPEAINEITNTESKF